MGDITRNLSRHEFACHCGCGLSDPHPLLVLSLQRVVDRTPGCRAVTITSGTRCGAHQIYLRTEGITRSTGSMHLVKHDRGGYSLAADCVFHGVDVAAALRTAMSEPDFALGGIGLYIGDTVDRLHLDVRKGRARWGVVAGNLVSYDDAVFALSNREKTA